MELLLTSLLATFVIGLSFGAGACMFTCIPTLGVMLLSQELDAREVAVQAWRFNLGRIVAYAMLAGLSGLVGASLASWLAMKYANLIFAAMLLASAVMLWRSGRVAGCSGGHRRPIRTGLFGIGFAMGLRPCAALAGVLAAAAAAASLWQGMLLGLAFGAGAVVVPQFVFGYGLAHAGQQMRAQLWRYRQRLARGGAGVLGVIAVAVGGGWLNL